jgi:hypothetical protein
MSDWSDLQDEMHRLPLDVETADRLLAGAVLSEDAPPGYAGVARLLAAARATEYADAAEVPSFLGAAVRTSHVQTTSSPRRSFVPRLKLAAVFATAALAGTTGLALAGSLPGAAQDVASSMLAKVGVSVPGPNEHAGTHPSVRGKSAEDSTGESTETETTATETDTETEASSGKGSEISALATSTDLTGVEKGAAISTLASGGQSQAGQHGQAGSEQGAPAGDASAEGRATAEEASGGHSSAGSGNAADGQSRRP